MSTTAAPPEQATEPGAPAAIPRGLAALIGLLAVAAALGVGHLVALLAPGSSPFFAVGDTVIRFSPQWLTEFAKTTFGTADKPILLGSMAVVIAIVAAIAGLASRRSARPGLTLVVVLGVVGLVVVIFAPTFGPLSVLAPIASIVAGVASFLWLHRLATRAAVARTGGPQVSRRNVLIGTAAVGAGAVVAGGGGVLLAPSIDDARARVTARLAAATLTETAPAIPAGAAFVESGTPPFVTSNAEFYRVDTALSLPLQSEQTWSLRIGGMVDRPLALDFDDIMSRPLVERTITMTCVSNVVGGPYISTADFIGVELRDVLLEAGIRPGADQLLSTALDGWTAGSPTDVIMEPGRGALIAVGMNGEALPAEHGFPARLIVPGLYGFLSATKWVTDIELTTFDAAQGYWLQRGWGKFAPIKTQSRIDFPKGLSTQPTGRLTVAGIAWSQPTGISRVEVRMDGGEWQDADLGDEVNTRTWRMWRTDFELEPGSHTVQTRATDRDGVTQTEMRADPIPDGASGWPATIFTVS